jgi:hypothetical protein
LSNDITFDTEKFAKELEELMEESENDELELAKDLDNIEGIDGELEKNTSENSVEIFSEELKPKEQKTGFEQTVVERKANEKRKSDSPYSVPTTTFRDPITKVDYPILSNHSPYPIIKKILKHNSVTGYTGIINAGQSGTGKTTWTKFLIHNLHQAMPAVVIDWFEQYDLVNIDNIINNLTKGVPHIIVFDDASFALDDLPKREINKLAQVLTRIRHVVKANVITIMNIHYSKAIGKYWRNIPFYFLTSISSEETQSYEDLFGSGAKWKLRDFSYLFHNMMLEGGWKVEIDAWKGKSYQYRTNKPFRVGLASELNRLHFFLYCRDSCGICDPDYATQRVISAPDMVDSLIASYNKNQVRSTLRYYMFCRKGNAEVIDRRVRSLWNTISDLDRKNDIDWQHVASVLDDTLKNKRKRYINKKQVAQGIAHVLDNATVGSKLEQQAKKFDPNVIGVAPVTSQAPDKLRDNSGEITYEDLDKTADEDLDNDRDEDNDDDDDDDKDDNNLNNPMKGAEWKGLDNNDSM